MQMVIGAAKILQNHRAADPKTTSVVTGAGRVEQVHENLKAFDVIEASTPPSCPHRRDHGLTSPVPAARMVGQQR